MKKELKARNWLIIYFIVLAAVLAAIAAGVSYLDPFFHYHKPLIEKFYYELDNERSQNDGIIKHFDYDTIIIGNSMTQNFKTTDVDRLFEASSVKLPLSGTTNKETGDLIRKALQENSGLKTVFRGFVIGNFLQEKDYLRTDLGEFPTYLYNQNPFDDVYYLFNRDVVFLRIYKMLKERAEGAAPGITSFDDYSYWSDQMTYGKNAVLRKKRIDEAGEGSADSTEMSAAEEQNKNAELTYLTENQKQMIRENVRQNITSIAEEYPDVDFYSIILPYSAAWWQERMEKDRLDMNLDIEKIAVEEMLKCPNIHIFSFDLMTDITTDLNNYKDEIHYGGWINTLILKYIKEGKYQLKQDNYQDYLDQVRQFYLSFDYSYLTEQEDYVQDEQAFYNLLNELADTAYFTPLSEDLIKNGLLSNAELKNESQSKQPEIVCRGTLQRDYQDPKELDIADYLYQKDYCGLRMEIDLDEGSEWLVFQGRKIKDHGQPGVYIYDSSGNVLGSFALNYKNLDDEWHSYGINIKNISGPVTVIFHGGYIDFSGSKDFQYAFKDIGLQ